MGTASRFQGRAPDRAGLVHRNRRRSPIWTPLWTGPIFLCLCVAAAGQERPAPEMEVFRAVSEALANQDATAFLDQFDAKMPHYDDLRAEIQELFGVAQEIGSTIDVITSDGNQLELDWLLKIDNDPPRRQIVKCQIEKQGKKWKITALEPVAFFKR